jgi:hypothetical protein
MQTVHHAPHDLGVAKLVAALRQGELSAVETAQHFLKRAQAQADLGAFLALDEEVTIAQARAADARLAGRHGRAAGRRAVGAQGHICHPRLPHHGRFEDVERLPVAV